MMPPFGPSAKRSDGDRDDQERHKLCTGNQIIWYFVGARKQAQKYLNFSAKWTLLAKPAQWQSESLCLVPKAYAL
ncbi:hypothetical protein RP75_19705 [Agrobacterium arsenijevicii]|uniref:Uncharacterized protein n=1 Tax=Agrobacterium arsenijevicii TaxID=1585697 RepID=A0ABR5D3U2_9HYPH|nr:hypothetical protein RP75_19705 [Agrobacterium arsenijevicii]